MDFPLRILFLALLRFSRENDNIVVLSCRSKRKIKGFTDTIMENNGTRLQLKFIHLVRPAFMEDDIKEFGDTRLIIED